MKFKTIIALIVVIALVEVVAFGLAGAMYCEYLLYPDAFWDGVQGMGIVLGVIAFLALIFWAVAEVGSWMKERS